MEARELINWNDFSKIDIRVGTVVQVLDFPEARNPSYQIHLDFGPAIGILKTSAQLTALYNKTSLLGCQLVAVVNFPKKQIANFMSECLILGAVQDKEVTLLQPMSVVKNGLKIS
ncbi:MAG: tRNA-binding protein [Flavobacteriaceae bacterium]|jgi:tRNA-binding protein